MHWFQTLQLFLNVLCFGLVFWFWNDRKSQVSEIQDSNTGFEAKRSQILEELRQDGIRYREQMVEQLRVLRQISEQAKRVLEGKQSIPNPFPPSEEENELKNILMKKNETRIPTVCEVESTRERLRSETGVDLRTLLRDQLA